MSTAQPETSPLPAWKKILISVTNREWALFAAGVVAFFFTATVFYSIGESAGKDQRNQEKIVRVITIDHHGVERTREFKKEIE